MDGIRPHWISSTFIIYLKHIRQLASIICLWIPNLLIFLLLKALITDNTCIAYLLHFYAIRRAAYAILANLAIRLWPIMYYHGCHWLSTVYKALHTMLNYILYREYTGLPKRMKMSWKLMTSLFNVLSSLMIFKMLPTQNNCDSQSNATYQDIHLSLINEISLIHPIDI